MSEEFMLAVVNGSGLKSVVLPICAAVLMCSCAVKATKLSWDDDFNKKLSFFGGAAFSAFFVLIPDTALTTVSDIAKAAMS
ncbi:hypothetical protein OG592_44565 (plasmid) [Streptomyces avidinii]|uniref:hypothetical protein n=1 Tax=Streptomyces avidinii TaxID=1895 RepID=UPI002F915BF0|nr:hypothetical protein OG592_44565 [Streptomyces avidinii]